MPKKITIEDLAGMVGKGFKGVDQRLKGVDQRLNSIDRHLIEVDQKLNELEKRTEKRFGELAEALTKLAKNTDENFRHVTLRLDRVREDISDIPDMRQALSTLEERVMRLERRAAAAK